MKARKSIVTRIFGIVLSLALVLSMIPATAKETDAAVSITAYVTVSSGGTFLKDKNGNDAVRLEVSLTGQDAYTVNDAFAAVHDQYYSGGAAGYVTEYSATYGSYSITGFWGEKTNYNCGYYVNDSMANGVSDPISNGDDISFFLYLGTYGTTMESYSFFTQKTATATTDYVDLQLKSAGFDESYNTVYSAVQGATITIDGQATTVTTDANGQARVTFEENGTYIISAVKDADANGITDITAPYCVVTVSNIRHDQTITVKKASLKKTFKVRKYLKKKKTFKIKATAKTKLTFKKLGGSKKITVSKTGKVTVKKKTKPGIYKVRIKITAAESDEYNSATVKKTLKITVKKKTK